MTGRPANQSKLTSAKSEKAEHGQGEQMVSVAAYSVSCEKEPSTLVVKEYYRAEYGLITKQNRKIDKENN